MIRYLLISIISFIIGLFIREIMDINIRKKKYRTLQPLYKQNFTKAMKELEVK